MVNRGKVVGAFGREGMTLEIRDADALAALKDYQKIISKGTPAAQEKMMDIFVRDMKNAAKAKRMKHPRGELSRSVRKRKETATADNITWTLVMHPYGIVVDRGRAPGKWPPDVPKIRRWAQAEGIPVNVLRRKISMGTKGKNFISPTLKRSLYKVKKKGFIAASEQEINRTRGGATIGR